MPRPVLTLAQAQRSGALEVLRQPIDQISFTRVMSPLRPSWIDKFRELRWTRVAQMAQHSERGLMMRFGRSFTRRAKSFLEMHKIPLGVRYSSDLLTALRSA